MRKNSKVRARKQHMEVTSLRIENDLKKVIVGRKNLTNSSSPFSFFAYLLYKTGSDPLFYITNESLIFN